MSVNTRNPENGENSLGKSLSNEFQHLNAWRFKQKRFCSNK